MADKNTPASTQPPAEQAATASAAPAPKKSRTRYLTPALALVAALIVGGVAGVLIGQNTASASNASSLRGGFPGGQGGPGGYGAFGGGQGQNGGAPGAGGGFASGTITAIDGNTITIKKADGSTVKVTTSGSTTVTKSSTANVSDLSTGEKVTAIGQADSSGNVTANRISEGDGGLGGFGGGFPGGAPTAGPTN